MFVVGGLSQSLMVIFMLSFEELLYFLVLTLPSWSLLPGCPNLNPSAFVFIIMHIDVDFCFYCLGLVFWR